MVPITYTNAKGKTSYLHQGTTKTGKPKYYFSMESQGSWRSPFLRGLRSTKIPMPRSSYAEFLRSSLPMRNAKWLKTACANMQSPGLQNRREGQRHCGLYRRSGYRDPRRVVQRYVSWSRSQRAVKDITAPRYPLFADVAVPPGGWPRRRFTAQRYCFVGSVDDWIAIGQGPLATLVRGMSNTSAKSRILNYFDDEFRCKSVVLTGRCLV